MQEAVGVDLHRRRSYVVLVDVLIDVEKGFRIDQFLLEGGQ
jgi:hypothetical protein